METEPGILVTVQVPVAGKPLRTTLPVERVHVGWVIVPTVGAVGVAGCGLIKTIAEAGETHPEAFVTVKVYVPATSPGNVAVVPDPIISIPIESGDFFTVQFPVAGKPEKTTLPVSRAQVGWVVVTTIGDFGSSFTIIGKMDTIPFPQELAPKTVTFPETAEAP